MSRGHNNDRQARELFGTAVYDAIPKSAFAMAAWHLANESSGTCDVPGAAEKRFLEELQALAASGLVPPRLPTQVDRLMSRQPGSVTKITD